MTTRPELALKIGTQRPNKANYMARLTFTIDPRRAREAIAALQSLSRRANKLSLPRLTYSKGRPYRYAQQLVGEFLAVDVTIVGAPLILNDWEILGIVEHRPRGNKIMALDSYFSRVLPHVSTEPFCDHCNYRRSRNQTVIISQGDRTLQIGEECLRGFITFYDPHKVLGYFRQLVTVFRRLESTDENGFGRGGRLLPAKTA